MMLNGKEMDYSKLPPHMQEGMRDYMEHRIPVGSFLYCVLANDLAGAVTHADAVNRFRLLDFIHWLYEWAPPKSYGSGEAVKAWLNERKL